MICVFYFRVVTAKVAKLKRAGQVNRGKVARAQENVRWLLWPANANNLLVHPKVLNPLFPSSLKATPNQASKLKQC